MRVMFLDLESTPSKSGYGEIIGSFGVKDDMNKIVPYFIIMKDNGEFEYAPISKCHKDHLSECGEALHGELDNLYRKQKKLINSASEKFQQELDKMKF